jgi:hypothetical protein
MHSLMSAILLGMSRIRVLRLDFMFDKLDSKTSQALYCLNSAK